MDIATLNILLAAAIARCVDKRRWDGRHISGCRVSCYYQLWFRSSHPQLITLRYQSSIRASILI